MIFGTILSVILLSSVNLTIIEPVDGETYNGDWLTIRAIVENENELPDSVHYTLNGESVIQVPRLNTDWYTYMANDCRTGYSESPAPHDNTILWSAPVSGTIHEFVSPVIVDGRVYYASEEDEIAYCLDAASGSEIWRLENIGDPIDDAMHVQDGRVYLASDSIWCLDAYTGDRIWAFGEGAPYGFSGPPVPYQNRIYVCDGPIHCLDLATGIELWETSYSYNTKSTMTAWNGMLFVPTFAAGAALYALDTGDGSIIWQNTDASGGYWDSSPVVVDNMIYINSVYGHTLAINAINGNTEWNVDLPYNHADATSAYFDGRLFFAHVEDGPYYCLDATDGSTIWIAPYDQHGSSGIADGLVFFGEYHLVTDSASVVALDVETGTEVWSFRTACGVIGFQSSPSITDGVMYFPCTDGYLYAFGTGLKYTYLDDLYARVGSNELIVTSFDSGIAAAADTVNFTVTQTGITLGSSGRLALCASPNPFYSAASISFELSEPGWTSVTVYDLSGRIVRTLVNSELGTGQHSIVWDGRIENGEPVSAGLYLCRIQSGGVTETTGLCLLR